MQALFDNLPSWASAGAAGGWLFAGTTAAVIIGAAVGAARVLARRAPVQAPAAPPADVEAAPAGTGEIPGTPRDHREDAAADERRGAADRRARRDTRAARGSRDVLDPLTGLVGRPAFEEALEEAAWSCDQKGGEPLAVLHIGLDDLRGLNEAFGKEIGDALLAQVAGRLCRLLGDKPPGRTPSVARLGGEEFALALRGEEADAIGMAAHVVATLARPFDVNGQALGLTASVGVACYPAHGAWSRLLAHGAAATRHVRQLGGNGHALFTAAMAVDLREQALLLQDLRRAVERGELKLLYQPKIDAASLQVTAAEALLRWEHPKRGVVPPTVFIALAERHGLMGAIGEWVVAEACRQAAVWREKGLRMRIAINISGHQLRHDRFVAQLEEQARQHGIPPARLTCEITETVAMEDTAQTRIAFQRLRRAGFHVSIDDFGTGHSSLAVLRRLPAAELKVDRSFIVDLASSASARSIVEAIMSVARTLGLRVVAEGVETEAQRDILVRMGCDELQGYLFARPMTGVALALWAEGGDPGSQTGTQTPPFRPSLFEATDAAPVDA
ncbi:MAG: bifunctional diguanylate cyclase/phosphodiesterase [Rubrivivax sp.]|nr:bifunctional diguanylate cyclase/phosphodiesterase [Rubrivivax sp.]